MRTVAFALCAISSTCFAAPAPAFTGPDFSGTCDCKGQDQHEGPYTSTVTMNLVPGHSAGQQGAYAFKMEVPGYGTYPRDALP